MPVARVPKLTHRRLLEAFKYCPKTGLFTWRIDTSGKNSTGKIAGAIGKSGYRKIGLDREMFRASRLAWFYMKGRWPKKFIDHKNGKTSDDRFENLREADCYTNQRNRRGSRFTGNPYKGIYWHKKAKKWAATIRVRGKEKYLGLFAEAKEAAEAYDAAAICLFGEFALLNFKLPRHIK